MVWFGLTLCLTSVDDSHQQNADEELLTGGTTDVEDSDSERKEGVDVLIVVVHNADAFVGAIEGNRTLLA